MDYSTQSIPPKNQNIPPAPPRNIWNSKLITIIIIVIVLVGVVVLMGGYFVSQYAGNHKQNSLNSPLVATNNLINNSTNNLTLSDIKNTTYTIAGTQIQFSNGTFHPERNNANSTDQGLNSAISSYAFGDINGDGRGDAVVITESGMGASNTRTDALQIVLNLNGKPQTTNVTIPGRIEGSLATGFSVLSIDNTGLITIQLLTSSTTVTRQYRYSNGILVELGATATGATNVLKTYTDTINGFSIQYDSSLTVNTSKPAGALDSYFDQDTHPTAELLLSINSGPETLSISVSPDPKDVGNCMVKPDYSSSAQKTVQINAVSFLTYGTGDAGMGHWTGDANYHTIRNNACWSITTEVQGINPGVYDDEKAAADAQNKELAAAAALIDPIVQTFNFTNGITTMSPPTCDLTADKVEYSLGDVINLTWSTQGANRAFWYQPIDPNSPTRKNIVPPQGIPALSGRAATVANIKVGWEPITMQVAGQGGFGTCSANVSIKQSNAQPSITIDSGTISVNGNSAGNTEVMLYGTATNGALYNDDINLVLFNANAPGPFDEATVYQSAFGQRTGPWLSGGADVPLRDDNLPFEHWTVKAYAPTGTTRVRVLAYPFFSSSVDSPTQPIVSTVITLTQK